jgi:integrase
MRPDEVTIMRPCDIDTAKKDGCWTYVPGQHKNSWPEGMEHKEIFIGPKAQALLKPWLAKTGDEDYLFDPRNVVAAWRESRRNKGKSTKAMDKLAEQKPLRPCYNDSSYRVAVKRACKRANVDEWTPNQLRHNAGTLVRQLYGIEASKLVLGHRHLNTTEIYAERDKKKNREIIAAVG